MMMKCMRQLTFSILNKLTTFLLVLLILVLQYFVDNIGVTHTRVVRHIGVRQ